MRPRRPIQRRGPGAALALAILVLLLSSGTGGTLRSGDTSAGPNPGTAPASPQPDLGPCGGLVVPPDNYAVRGAVSSTNVTASAEVNFTAAASGGDGDPSAYAWNFGDRNRFGGPDTSSMQDPSYSYGQPGSYLSVVVAETACDWGFAITPVNVSAASTGLQVLAHASDPVGDAPWTVNFSAAGSGGSGDYTYYWDFGDRGAGTGANASHRFDRPGVYAVGATVSDSQGDRAVYYVTVVIGPGWQLGLSVNASASAGPAPLTVQFTSRAFGWLPPYQYNWTLGAGAKAVQAPNASCTYDRAGTYRVELYAVDLLGDVAVGWWNVSVGPPLPLNASIRATVTSGGGPLQIYFAGGASGGIPPYSYAWAFGDGQYAWTQDAVHAYGTAGPYVVTFQVTDATGTNRTTYLDVGTPASTGVPLAIEVEDVAVVVLGAVAVLLAVGLLIRRGRRRRP